MILSALALFATAGCEPSAPSANGGKREIQRQIDAESEGRIDLLNFRKTNGQRRELFGRKLYALEFEASIEYTEACRADMGYFGAFSSFKTTELPKKIACSGGDLACAQNRLLRELNDSILVADPDVRKGHTEHIAGVMTFEKMERGWRAVSLTMKREPR